MTIHIDHQTTLAVVRQARGCVYTRLRDAALEQEATLRPLVAAARDRGDWPSRTQALVLEGWWAHGDTFRQVLERMDAVDVEWAQVSQAGLEPELNELAERAEHDWGPAVLPLCWERLWKYGPELPPWQAQIFLLLVETLPDPRSAPPVTWFAQQVVDPVLQDTSVRTLITLPVEGLKDEIEALFERYWRLAGALQRGVRTLEQPP